MARDFIPFAQPMFGAEEKREVGKALDSGWATLGPRTKQFEDAIAEYVGAKHAVAVSSCTAALHLSLLAAGIGKGDEVITSVFTFAATINAILYTGATPVLVDIDPKTLNIDPSLIEAKITKKTKAIIPVHYAGYPCDMTAIKKIAKAHSLTIIEDAAHAIGTSYKNNMIGSIGDFTCFSFHPIKNISTGDGGLITTNSKKHADLLQLWRLHGMSKEAWKRLTKAGSWRYDIKLPGYKYNMTDVSAALGLIQLTKLEKFMEKRDAIAAIYDDMLGPIDTIQTPIATGNVRHSRNLYSVLIDVPSDTVRDELIETLKSEGIGTNVYFVPLHYFTYFKSILPYKIGDFPVVESVYPKLLCLPIYPKMTLSDARHVAKTLIAHMKQYSQ